MDDIVGTGLAAIIFVGAICGLLTLPHFFLSTVDEKIINQCKQKGYYYYDSKTKMVCTIEQ